MANEERSDRYFHLLDSLARFYNSQITAHIGYQITVFAILTGASIALFSSIVVRAGSLDWKLGVSQFLIPDWTVRWFTLGVLLLVYIIWALPLVDVPFTWKYLYGRVQYYVVLSEIAFEHMGVKGLAEVGRLRQRAENREGGIEKAVLSMLEARLFVAKWARLGKKAEDLQWRFPEREEYLRRKYARPVASGEFDAMWEDVAFTCTTSDINRSHPYLKRYLFWPLVDLLVLAYKHQISNQDLKRLVEDP